MISKQTWLNVSDGTNILWAQTFHLYKGFYRRFSEPGFFLKGSARVVEPPRLEYKGFKVKFSKKGDICRGFIVRAVFRSTRSDGTCNFFKDNNIIIIRKRQDIKSKYLFGFVTKKIRRKKFLSVFKVIS